MNTQTAPSLNSQGKERVFSESNHLADLADIYQEQVNLAVWHQVQNQSFVVTAEDFVKEHPRFQFAQTLAVEDAYKHILRALGGDVRFQEIGKHIAELVDMFCCLFDLKQAGIRLAVLENAMCPRFHVDRVPCRLVSTLQGCGTEWLPHTKVDRKRLGLGNNGLPDHESGLYQSPDDIRQLQCGDVALLKGELWPGNEQAGLVHRSPSLSQGQSRFLITLDFAS